MARKIKLGLDYMPFTYILEPSVKLIRMDVGGLVSLIYYPLVLKMGHDNGYYIEWNDLTRDLFAQENALEPCDVDRFVESALKRGCFSREIYNKYSILTSAEIQNIYLTAMEKRSIIPINPDIFFVNIFTLSPGILKKISVANSNDDLIDIEDLTYSSVTKSYCYDTNGITTYKFNGKINSPKIPISVEEIPENADYSGINRINSPEMQQIKLNKIKLNKIKENEIKSDSLGERGKIKENKIKESSRNGEQKEIKEEEIDFCMSDRDYPPPSPPKEQKNNKLAYGSGYNVLLTRKEYEMLKSRYPKIDAVIERFSNYQSTSMHPYTTRPHSDILKEWAEDERYSILDRPPSQPLPEVARESAEEDDIMLWAEKSAEKRSSKCCTQFRPNL